MRGERWVDTSKTFVCHPDQAAALKKYKKGGDELDKMFDERNQILEDGGQYHNPLHDEEFAETAKENTDNAITQRGWKYPGRKKR